MISRRPALAAAVILPIALAIAVNTALFSVMDGLLFRPLPFDRPHELIAIDYRYTGDRPPDIMFMPHLSAERERLRDALEGSPLISAATQAGFTRNLWTDTPELGVQPVAADSRFFRLLGLDPLVGAHFNKDDEQIGQSAAAGVPIPVIIGHGLWKRVFGEDPNVLGVRDLGGQRVRIVGVMPAGVKFPGETTLWAARRTVTNRPPTYARLAAGASTEQLAARFPDLQFTPLEDDVRPDGATTLVVLFAAACLLLVVAWVQVGALVFAGTVGRVHELGVRLALGAGRSRVVREFALENVILAGAAFGVAWLAARPLTAFVVSALPIDLTSGQYLEPDARTFVFACGVSLVGLAFLTLLPLGLIRHTSPLQLLQGRAGGLPFRAERIRYVLLVAQVTLTTTLLYLSGLMVHSFVQASTYDYGFDSERVLLFTPPLPPLPVDIDLSKYAKGDAEVHARLVRQDLWVRDTLEVLRSAPSVIAAASFGHVPLTTRGERFGSSKPGAPTWPPRGAQTISLNGRKVELDTPIRGNVVSPDFVRALGATLIAGQSFNAPDTATENAIVINETLARRLASVATPDGVPVGVVGSSIFINNERRAYRIVGVISDLVYGSPNEAALPQTFQLSSKVSGYVIVIRTRGGVDAALPELRTVLQRIWGPDLPSWHFSLLRDAWHAGLTPFRGNALLLSLVGGFCVPLAAIGLMGALLYSVRVRAREIAIRIALGAEPITVSRAVVMRSVTMVGFGLALGTGLGVAAGRATSHQLFNVHPADPWTIAAVAAALLTTGWLAALIPAAHAARTDLAVALRQE